MAWGAGALDACGGGVDGGFGPAGFGGASFGSAGLAVVFGGLLGSAGLLTEDALGGGSLGSAGLRAGDAFAGGPLSPVGLLAEDALCGGCLGSAGLRAGDAFAGGPLGSAGLVAGDAFAGLLGVHGISLGAGGLAARGNPLALEVVLLNICGIWFLVHILVHLLVHFLVPLKLLLSLHLGMLHGNVGSLAVLSGHLLDLQAGSPMGFSHGIVADGHLLVFPLDHGLFFTFSDEVIIGQLLKNQMVSHGW
eukprot:s2974_g4.t1